MSSRSRRLHSVLDFVLIVLGVMVAGVIGLYWKVIALEISYITTDASALTAMSTDSFKTLVSDTTARFTDSWERIDLDDLAVVSVDSVYSHSLESDLSLATRTTTPVFSLLPPGRYLRIPRLGIETPIVDVPFATPEKIQEGDFDDELKRGIVKYPFTALPGQQGNTLLFGHSSVDTFEQADNPFGFVFYSLPKLIEGDRIELIWDGNIYTYEVFERHIKRPQDVPDLLNKDYDAHQLTLMACYPLLSDAKRILIGATLVSHNGQPIGNK